MKSALIILSDLWGVQHSEWIKYYYEELKDEFEVNFLDSRALAGIDPDLDSEKSIHEQFIAKGIDVAVYRLMELSPVGSTIIGFSIGGLIAWKAALEGLPVKKLIAVSSTRLRYENRKPPVDINLFYGDGDQYKPEKKWFEQMSLNPQMLQGGHDIYKKAELVKMITEAV
ncbi:MAG: alpha/beta hydrolase [Bacteroidota bacterium]